MTPMDFTFVLVLRASRAVNTPYAQTATHERTFSMLPPPIPVGRASVSTSSALETVYQPNRSRTYHVFTDNDLSAVRFDDSMLECNGPPAFAYMAQTTPYPQHVFAARNLQLNAYGLYDAVSDFLVVTSNLAIERGNDSLWSYPIALPPTFQFSINARRLCNRWSAWTERGFSPAQRFEVLSKKLV